VGVYSLVSAPVLGFDLTRLDGGAAVADVLLRTLVLTPEDLDPIAAAGANEWDRIALWQDVETAARNRRELAARAGAAGREEVDPGLEVIDLAGALAVLERTPIGTVDGLLHCLRHDVMDWTWRRHPAGVVQLKSAARAASVLCDAAVAAYLRELLSDETRRKLAAPYVSAVRQVPERPVDLGPQATALRAFVDRIRRLTRADVLKLAAVTGQGRPGIADWAGAVHSASWAVFVSGRVRSAAAAQLMLVQAVDSAAVPVADRAGGVWNLLSGAAQALTVRDVLDSATLYKLLDPVVTALGPIAGPELVTGRTIPDQASADQVADSGE
jgi:hypothetical protein